MTCKFGESKREVPGLSWKNLEPNLIQKCPVFPGIVFSLSDYCLENWEWLSVQLIFATNDLLKGFVHMPDFILLSGLLFTIAENFAILIYLIYFPFYIMRKGINMMINLVILAFIVLIVSSFVFFSLDENNDKKINVIVERTV
eukprot:CAMPEP_0170550024 /NCGR_PEP_ID=MMETSP0211-20121228/8072_1 /TAXON_ID=311385 /ORGANISM="Pseudokeronopsis sp., Strain OXSARD2" /LENGTH=142 /DNA_ID=CAMNT_0010856289 /DNA_START=32 /DNA_END=460 /DNA_ORIENTATION=-